MICHCQPSPLGLARLETLKIHVLQGMQQGKRIREHRLWTDMLVNVSDSQIPDNVRPQASSESALLAQEELFSGLAAVDLRWELGQVT